MKQTIISADENNIQLQNDEPSIKDIINEDTISDEELETEISSNIQTIEESSTVLDTVFGEYIKSIKDIPLLTAEEEIDLATKIQNGDEHAKQELIKHNLKLVISISTHYYSTCMTQMDLIQEGNTGLITAAEKFNPTLGFRFSTYATWWIKQAITRAIANQGRIIRLPVHMLEKLSKINTVKKQLSEDLNIDNPSEKQIAEASNMTIDEVHAIMKYSPDTISYDIPVGEDEHGMATTLEEFLQDESNNTAENGEKYLIKETIKEAMSTLSEKERDIIIMRFGLNNERPMTLQEVGEKYHVTRERIRQIEAKALRKLRSPKCRKMLKDLIQ